MTSESGKTHVHTVEEPTQRPNGDFTYDCQECVAREAEVERLKGENERLRGELDRRTAEADRLRGAVEEAIDCLEGACPYLHGGTNDDISKRLRAALSEPTKEDQ